MVAEVCVSACARVEGVLQEQGESGGRGGALGAPPHTTGQDGTRVGP